MISAKDMKRLINSPYRLLAPVERLLLEKNDLNNQERDSLHLHPSEICKKDWCPRSSWYKIKGYPSPEQSFTLQRLNIFAEGHLIHKKWQDWLLEAGVLDAAEVPVVDIDHHIIGHADGVVNDKHGKAVLEIKSVGVGTIRMEDYGMFAPYGKKEITIDELWASIKYPFASHIRQTQLYMYCLGIHNAIILYEWKATQDVKEFAISFQPDIVDSILASCYSVVKALDEPAPPARPVWVSQEHRVCKSCPYKKECWSSSDEHSSNTRQDTDGGEIGWPNAVRPVSIPEQVSTTGTPVGPDPIITGRPRRVIR